MDISLKVSDRQKYRVLCDHQFCDQPNLDLSYCSLLKQRNLKGKFPSGDNFYILRQKHKKVVSMTSVKKPVLQRYEYTFLYPYRPWVTKLSGFKNDFCCFCLKLSTNRLDCSGSWRENFLPIFVFRYFLIERFVSSWIRLFVTFLSQLVAVGPWLYFLLRISLSMYY